jgi:hypothetical protein
LLSKLVKITPEGCERRAGLGYASARSGAS